MKLEELLGTELWAQVQAKIEAANAGKEDKKTHIRYADLSEGSYVARQKYDDLQTTFDNKDKELSEANALIQELKAASGQSDEAKQKITTYENTIAQLQVEKSKKLLQGFVPPQKD